MYRGEKTTHWCRRCILAAVATPKERVTNRFRVAALEVLSQGDGESRLLRLEPLRVEMFSVGELLTETLKIEPYLIFRLTAEQFEEFICDRLAAMGLEAQRVGRTNQKDGGIDVLFWPRERSSFPFLGAAQIKHHRDPSQKEGPSTVRDFQGAISGRPINAGLIITNTQFSPDAKWFAREHAKLIRLRGFSDIRRWLINAFQDNAEWREIPKSINLCPGITVSTR
jgi:hypothetical protein